MTRLSSYLLLIALAVAGMIPAGWMPAVGEDGKVLMVICTSEGDVEQWVDLDSDTSGHEPDDHDGDRVCPFGALSHTTAILMASPALPLKLAPRRSPWAHEVFVHHSAGFHWRYDARGPPALS